MDLRSDYRPSVDVDRVEVFLELGEGLERREEASLTNSDDLLGGHRVAEYDELAPGRYSLRLVVYREGTALVTRRVSVDLQDSLAITVVVSRSCEGVSCPQSGDPALATECIGGTCEPPECLPESPTSCLGSCRVDLDCPGLGRCGTGVCIETACYVEANDTVCPSGECRADLTCAPFDAGGEDVAVDVGTDVGPPPDAGFDSGPPPPSCPGNARDCPSDFTDWTRTGSWSCRSDQKLGRAAHTVTCRVCNAGGCRDCDYPGIVVECRCREPETCSSGRCTSGVSSSRSRCDDGSTEFNCSEITDRECD